MASIQTKNRRCKKRKVESISRHQCRNFHYPGRKSELIRCKGCKKPFTGIQVSDYWQENQKLYLNATSKVLSRPNDELFIFFREGRVYKFIVWNFEIDFVEDKFLPLKGGLKCLTIKMRIGLRRLQNQWRRKRRQRRSVHLSRLRLLRFDPDTNLSLARQIIDYLYP